VSFPEPAWLPEAMKKYRRKLHHVKLAKQIRGLEATVHPKGAAQQGRLDFFTQHVKAVLDRIGVYSDLHPSYLAYAHALDKSQREMEWMVDLIREHVILRQRWETRGLNAAILDEIDEVVIYRG